MQLSQFLRAAAAQPFVWGTRDCVLWPCEWIAIKYGVDPAAKFREAYADGFKGWRMIRDEGGLPALAERLGAACGFSLTDRPSVGDLGLCPVRPSRPLTGYSFGIFTGARFVFKAPLGVTATRVAPVLAWKL